MATWTLPYPTKATTNHLYRNSGPVILSDGARAWREESLLAIRRQGAPAPALWSGPLEVTIWAYVPDQRTRDVGNLEKLAVDTLFRELGIDDNRIVDLHLHKRPGAGEPRLVVCVHGAPAP